MQSLASYIEGMQANLEEKSVVTGYNYEISNYNAVTKTP